MRRPCVGFERGRPTDTTANPAFARTVELLGQSGYASVYHERTGERHGAETGASLYWYRHRDRPYLVDHAFVPRPWLPLIAEFELGDPSVWLAHSDYLPLVLDLHVPA